MTGKKDRQDGDQPGTGGGRPFGGKLDDVVAKIVPDRWLPTASVGASGAALIFFVLMIIGFSCGPKDKTEVDAKLKADLDKAQKAIQDERDRGKAAVEKVQADLVQLRTSLGEEKTARTNAERSIRQAEADAKKQQAEAERAGKKADNAEKALADLRVQYDTLKATKDEQARKDEVARRAFEAIMNEVKSIQDDQKALDTIDRMSAALAVELGGSITYKQALDKEIAYRKQAMDRRQREAEKEASRQAKETYNDAMKRYKSAGAYEEQIAILEEALKALKEGEYLDRIVQEIDRLRAARKEEVARELYNEVIARVAQTPKAYEENLKALEEALEKAAGTRYGDILQREINSKRGTLAEDIALAAYKDLAARIKQNATAYDDNIAAAEAALKKAENTRYQDAVKKLLDSQVSMRLDAIGSQAHADARKQVKESKDRAANVRTLEGLKAKAEGSVWAAKIDRLLQREKTLQARESGN